MMKCLRGCGKDAIPPGNFCNDHQLAGPIIPGYVRRGPALDFDITAEREAPAPNSDDAPAPGREE